jgi:hypothetical protein
MYGEPSSANNKQFFVSAYAGNPDLGLRELNM